MRRSLSCILLAVVLLFSLTPVSQAEKQPIIVYSLKFVELDAASVQSFKGKLKVEASKKGGKWQVISTERMLEYVHNNSQQFSLVLTSTGKKEQSQIYYDSWLTTIGKQIVSVELNERLVGPEGEEGGSYFQFYLQPLQIDQEQDRIQTRIKFKHRSKLGAKAKTETNVWVKSSGGKPVAVVVQKTAGNNRRSRRYFALYITGKIASGQHLDKKVAMVAMGNLQEMNNLFGGEVGPDRDQKEIGFYVSPKTYGLKAEWQRENSKLYGEISQEDGQFIYNTEVNYSLWGTNNLFLAGKIENRTTVQSDLVLRLGFKDRVTWKDGVKLQVAYYPIGRGLGSKVKADNWGEVKLKFQRPQWSIWYAGEWRNSSYFKGGGISYELTEQWQLTSEWKQSHQQDGKIYLNVIWNLTE